MRFVLSNTLRSTRGQKTLWLPPWAEPALDPPWFLQTDHVQREGRKNLIPIPTGFAALPKGESALCHSMPPRQAGIGLPEFLFCSQLCSSLAASAQSWWLCAGNQLPHFPQARLHLCARKDWQRRELWELPQHLLPSQLAVGTLGT